MDAKACTGKAEEKVIQKGPLEAMEFKVECGKKEFRFIVCMQVSLNHVDLLDHVFAFDMRRVLIS